MNTYTPGLNNLSGISPEQSEAMRALANLHGVAPDHPEDTQDTASQPTTRPLHLPLGVLPEKPYIHGGSGPSAN